jgi:hypothetical protein
MTTRKFKAKDRGTARRCLALVMIALFAHAVVLDLLHRHALAAEPRPNSFVAGISTPHDMPSREPHSGDNCPACQLQHGFVFLKATPPALCVDVAASVEPDLTAPSAAHRIAEGSAPSRAPPAR